MAVSGFSLIGSRASKGREVNPAHKALKETKACAANRVRRVSKG
jgi:hypothetical protein